MRFNKALTYIKKKNKIKHKSWNHLMISDFYNNTAILDDDKGYLYYFNLDDFVERFGILKNGWELVSDNEYKIFSENIERNCQKNIL